MFNNVVIVSAKRTPIGNFRGKLSSLSAVEIGSISLKKAIKSVKLDPDLIDELIVGHVLQAGCGQAPAKQLAYKSGINMKTPCTSINKVCSSGIKAICLAAQSIELGINEIVVAGGIESMSQAPYYINNKDLEKIVETNDEWIFERTGIRERRISSTKGGEWPTIWPTTPRKML